MLGRLGRPPRKRGKVGKSEEKKFREHILSRWDFLGGVLQRVKEAERMLGRLSVNDTPVL